MSEELKKMITQTKLLEIDGDDVEGQMLMQVNTAHGARNINWINIADYDENEYLQRIVLFIPDTEFLVGENRFKANQNGGTDVTISWRVVGITEEGNEAVMEYANSGMFETQMKQRVSRLNEYIKNK